VFETYLSKSDIKKAATLARAICQFKEFEEKVKEVKIKDIAFDIEYDDKRGKWFLVTGYCQVGGCSVYGYFFNTRAEAIKKGKELTLLGKEPESGPACYSCRAYLREIDYQDGL
jgi:hypothetical protein